MSKKDHKNAAKLTKSAAGCDTEADAPELETLSISLQNYEARLQLRDYTSFHSTFHNKEQNMTWLSENWIWVLFGVAFVAMHLFGHGGHGSHVNHRRSAGDDPAPGSANRNDSHRH